VIDALEDAEDYAAFEMAVTADYDAQSAVEREPVLRLASLLWRLRRATTVETGLFKLQAQQLQQFRARKQSYRDRQKIIGSMCRHAVAVEGDIREDQEEPPTNLDPDSPEGPTDPSDDLTRAFIRLNNLPTYPLDRLSRYEAALWRQACQLLFTLRCLGRRNMESSDVPLIHSNGVARVVTLAAMDLEFRRIDQVGSKRFEVGVD
jgi:hypothetical protein